MNEDVFPIQDGDFPACYVCLPEGTICFGPWIFFWIRKNPLGFFGGFLLGRSPGCWVFRQVSWPEGFKLAAQMGYRFPQLLGELNKGGAWTVYINICIQYTYYVHIEYLRYTVYNVYTIYIHTLYILYIMYIQTTYNI